MTQDLGHMGATVRRWQLTETLRRLREDAGYTHDQVVAELRRGYGKWSRPKLSRIENRGQGIKSHEIEQLLDVYQVHDQDLRNWLTELADTRRTNGWMLDLRKNLPDDFHAFLELEVTLVASRTFETLLVPGLLQTSEYSRAVIEGVHPDLTEDQVGRRVTARLTRQQILHRQPPPRLHVILDEGVLERPVGSASVMRNQLRRLAEATEVPHITIQILPKSVGASPALEGPFSILTLPDPIPDVGYSEGPGPAVYIEDRDQVRRYTLRFGALTERSLSQTDSISRIKDAAHTYE